MVEKYITKHDGAADDKKHCFNFLNSPIGKLDWMAFIVIAVFCFFVFLHNDILNTAGSSISYLGGHILDFYEYNVINGVEDMNNYMPSTYILFSIWNIPIYLLNIVSCPVYVVEKVSMFAVFWYKTLPVLFFLLSGFLVGKIGEILGFSNKKIKLLVFVFLTTPIAFFSPLIFGQYDSFTVFFVLLGVYYYLKENRLRFVLFFGIAMTFKYFALIIFLPLLLLLEKNIFKIMRDCLVFSVPFILESLVYITSDNFNLGVFHFKTTNYILNAGLNVYSESGRLSVFILGFVFILFWAYSKKFEGENAAKDRTLWAIYFCNAASCFVFAVSMWHPQWLIFMTPFMVISCAINVNSRLFLIIDSIIFLMFSMLCVILWHGSVDENLMFKGILKNFIDFDFDLTASMSDFCVIKNMTILFSCFSALLLVNIIFKHPRFCDKDFGKLKDSCNFAMRFRLLSIVLFWILPAICCIFISSIRAHEYILKNTDFPTAGKNVGLLVKDRVFEQYFRIPKGISYIDEVRGSFFTSARTNDSRLLLLITSCEDNKVIFKGIYNAYECEDILPTKFELDEKVGVKENGLYKLSLSSIGADAGNSVSIYRTNKADEKVSKGLLRIRRVYGGERAKVDGVFQPYNLCVDILGG